MNTYLPSLLYMNTRLPSLLCMNTRLPSLLTCINTLSYINIHLFSSHFLYNTYLLKSINFPFFIPFFFSHIPQYNNHTLYSFPSFYYFYYICNLYPFIPFFYSFLPLFLSVFLTLVATCAFP